MEQLSKRQEEIIQVSIKIIAEHGIQHLTIKNISTEIKISEPAIYRHFKSKMEIILAILAKFKVNSQILAEAMDSNPATSIKKIGIIYNNNFNKFNENPALASVIFSEEIFQNEIELSTMVKSIMEINQKTILKIIKFGQKNKEIRNDIPEKQIALIIMGTLRLLVTKWRLSKYSFNLIEEGYITLESITKLIKE